MTEQLLKTLIALELHQYFRSFTQAGITDDVLGQLTDADLERVGIASFDHRMRLLEAFGVATSSEPGEQKNGPVGEPGGHDHLDPDEDDELLPKRSRLPRVILACCMTVAVLWISLTSYDAFIRPGPGEFDGEELRDLLSRRLPATSEALSQEPPSALLGVEFDLWLGSGTYNVVGWKQVDCIMKVLQSEDLRLTIGMSLCPLPQGRAMTHWVVRAHEFEGCADEELANLLRAVLDEPLYRNSELELENDWRKYQETTKSLMQTTRSSDYLGGCKTMLEALESAIQAIEDSENEFLGLPSTRRK